MGKLFQSATDQRSLRRAWQRIRSNGSASSAAETRVAVEMFDREETRNIATIQKRLRAGTFEFEPQTGVTKKKKSGDKRGIVLASIHNRIVERAWLDCLQGRSRFIQRVINQPTSVGCVPNRSVPHGLRLIRDAFLEGKNYFARSDICGFFDNIPRKIVLERIAKEIDDEKFLSTLDAATRVVLANEGALGEDRRVFPTDDEGVAQGSPLSPLFGNILLNDFDLCFNDRGITCVRFVDDFVILGKNERAVNRAFQNAKATLANLGLTCHDPYAAITNAEKAAFGRVEDGFVFLGYDLRPGLLQPSRVARQKLEKTVDDYLFWGRRAILDVKKAADSFESRQRYAQTLTLIDKVSRGWGEAFAYGNARSTIEDLDKRIDKKLDSFRGWFVKQTRQADWKTKRRLGGVCLLSDVKPKSLDDVPFVLEPGGRVFRSSKTVTISTDGSIASQPPGKGKDQGPGGWSFVVHETGEEQAGRVSSSTNNQMELRAVIEAIRSVPPEKSIIVRTDSQYVHDAVNRGSVVKSNFRLWSEYQETSRSRRVKVVWIKGHAGDPHNERADQLAAEQAKLAKDNSGMS